MEKFNPNISYSGIFIGSASEMAKIGQEIRKRLTQTQWVRIQI